MDKFEIIMREIAINKKQALHNMSTSPAAHIIHRAQGTYLMSCELEELAARMESGDYQKEQEIQSTLDKE